MAFVKGPPFPAVYGPAAALALGLGLVGGFAVGLYALGGPAFGWPAGRYLALVQAHGQVQTLGLAGLLILGVGALLLPGFWRAKVARPHIISYGGGLVGAGLLAQLVGQPLDPGLARSLLLIVAAILPPVGFAWAGSELLRPRLQRPGCLFARRVARATRTAPARPRPDRRAGRLQIAAPGADRPGA